MAVIGEIRRYEPAATFVAEAATARAQDKLAGSGGSYTKAIPKYFYDPFTRRRVTDVLTDYAGTPARVDWDSSVS